MKIPLRLLDWKKVKKTGRGYTYRELSVIKILQEAAERTTIGSFLNVGFHDFQDRRNRWWIDICKANNIDWHILELFPGNVENFKKHTPEQDHHRITLGNIKDITTLFDRKFDVIFHWHGPEHLLKNDYLSYLPVIVSTTAKLLILGCPNGHEEQGAAYGNPYEEHISFWTPEEFHALGFKTDIVSDKKIGHITAYRYLEDD